MKLDYIDATGNGRFPKASPKNLVRLFDFSDEQIELFVSEVKDFCQNSTNQLDIDKLPYIHALNCSVSFKISENDIGLVKAEHESQYVCLLTKESYINMIDIIERVIDGHNWLTPGEYLDEPAFLISKYGSW